MQIQHPDEIKWVEGELPDVHMVPKNCSILAWFVYDFPGGPDSKAWLDIKRYSGMELSWEKVHGSFKSIKRVYPDEDEMNPLRWCGSSGYPIGWEEKVKYWAWVYREEE